MPRPKVIVQLYPMLPADGEEGRKRDRPVGRDAGLYHTVLHDWMDIVKAADDMGVWGVSTIEHHLHSEGYEVGPNPGILNAWWASQVKNAHVGALGYVMATQDPIRVAEETAILDHITKGKFFVGLARGYQSRWTNILGQFTDSVATLGDGSRDDHRNRDIFEERVDMLIKCWTEDSVVLDGQYYQAPYPLDTGVEGYPANAITQHAGAIGEADENGAIRRVSVVPKPFQNPYPPVFVAASKSPASIEYCARMGFIPTYFMNMEGIVDMTARYVKVAADCGRPVQLGEKQNIVRWPHICDSQEEFDRRLAAYDMDIYKNFYGPFFPQFPQDPNTDFLANMKQSGVFIGGTVDESIAQWKAIYDQVPAEYITLIWHYAQQPKDEVIEELALFMTEVLPELEVPFE